MAESKHTPKPWHAARMNSTTINVVPHRIHGFRAMLVGGSDGQVVAHTFGKTAEETEANARLIAAAPDLLDAIKPLLSFLESELEGDEAHPFHKDLAAARAAIAKAEA